MCLFLEEFRSWYVSIKSMVLYRKLSSNGDLQRNLFPTCFMGAKGDMIPPLGVNADIVIRCFLLDNAPPYSLGAYMGFEHMRTKTTLTIKHKQQEIYIYSYKYTLDIKL
jgi:hypothetical protein